MTVPESFRWFLQPFFELFFTVGRTSTHLDTNSVYLNKKAPINPKVKIIKVYQSSELQTMKTASLVQERGISPDDAASE